MVCVCVSTNILCCLFCQVLSFFSISVIWFRKCLSVSIRLLTVLHACSTVAWSLPPMCEPMLASDAFVRLFEKNIDTWRACTISRFLVFPCMRSTDILK